MNIDLDAISNIAGSAAYFRSGLATVPMGAYQQ
jgi:hypothetical protein